MVTLTVAQTAQIPWDERRNLWAAGKLPCLWIASGKLSLWRMKDYPGDTAAALQEDAPAEVQFVLARTDENGVPLSNEAIKATALFEKAMAEMAEAWLQHVAVEIGLGFHPDTSAEDYSPPLPEPLASEYDPLMSIVFEELEDPYDVSVKAWEDAGIIEKSEEESPSVTQP